MYRATDLSRIESANGRWRERSSTARFRRADGGQDRLDWQTLYFCARSNGRWKISGFVGYLPRFAE